MPPTPVIYIVCIRCGGSGTEHESTLTCSTCQGARVLCAPTASRVAALEFLRVAQPILALPDFEGALALRQAVAAVAAWLAAHPETVTLDPPSTPIDPRKPK